MNREEAIKQLEVYRACMMVDGAETDAYDIAIEALEQQPCEDEELDFVQPHKKIKVNIVPCEDAISRQAVRDLICRNNDKYGYSDRFHEFTEECLNLPPVTVQANKEDIHREREQAYMRGYEDGSRKYRTEQSEDAISRQAAIDAMYSLCGDGTLKENEWRDNPHIDSIIDALKDLPSVSTEKTDSYKQGWHDAIGKALDEAYDIVIDGERFSVVQEETLVGLGMAYEQVSTEKTGRWIPVSEKYEYHIDHTDCIWYGSDSGCPVTCSQYRDGWNDAMDYIFKNGDGYRPYRRNENG